MDPDNEIIKYAAPRWAWHIIFGTLALDMKSSAFDRDLRDDIERAVAEAKEEEQEIGTDKT